MAIKLTKKQQALLDFLQDFMEEKGITPSYREIQAGLELSSVSAVAEHIDNLVEKGVLKKVPGAARSLEILDYKHEETVELFRVKMLECTEEEKKILEKAMEIYDIIYTGEFMAQKRKKKKTNVKKWAVRGFLLILLIVAGVISFMVWDSYFNKKKDDKKPGETSQVEEKKDSDDDKDAEREEEATEVDLSEKEVKQYEGENPNSAGGLTGVITHAGVSGGSLAIRVNIDQYLESGTCILGLRKEGMNVYSAEAKISASASTATGEGFDVPTSGLESGSYTIVIYLSSGTRNGEIDGEVKI